MCEKRRVASFNGLLQWLPSMVSFNGFLQWLPLMASFNEVAHFYITVSVGYLLTCPAMLTVSHDIGVYMTSCSSPISSLPVNHSDSSALVSSAFGARR